MTNITIYEEKSYYKKLDVKPMENQNQPQFNSQYVIKKEQKMEPIFQKKFQKDKKNFDHEFSDIKITQKFTD